METVNPRYDALKNALQRLEEIGKKSKTDIIRDATIQRFEFTYEAAWKALRYHLMEKHGTVCHSPKSCFREALTVGILTPEQTEMALQMTDDRNLTTHTYDEALADQIYQRILEHYLSLFLLLWQRIKEETDS
jgi:nucleotidyltransferase substrate binding protein (TIGR01987 family)